MLIDALTLDEALYLLTIDPATGYYAADDGGVCVAAASLVELARGGALRVRDGRLSVEACAVVPRPHLAEVLALVATGRRRYTRLSRVVATTAGDPLWTRIGDSLAERSGLPASRFPAYRVEAAHEFWTRVVPVVLGASPAPPPRLVLLAGLLCLTGRVPHSAVPDGSWGRAAQHRADRLLTDPVLHRGLTRPAAVAQSAITAATMGRRDADSTPGTWNG